MKKNSSKNTNKVILVTGGTGYIGSHAAIALTAAGYKPVIADNLSNSKASVLDRIAEITGIRPPFYKISIQDRTALDVVFQEHPIAAVIHFAGLKAVGESVMEPLRYYENNIESAVSLCTVMSKRGVKRLIFSSSAAIYGEPPVVPVKEDCTPAPTNPYARSKLIIEQILQDVHAADSSWRIIILRYFNPAGAHESGLIGEYPQGVPNNLMPCISQVAVGSREKINIYGNDYPTSDGTGMRDYIHVMDLAEGHVAALKKMDKTDYQNPLIINLGTGQGYTVMEMLRAFEEASGKKIPYQITGRRSGDVAACFADPSLAMKLLKWKAKRSLADMCGDAWRWQSRNPRGYE
ncbi:MAG TPA: UDP-glucose 4-epimerase GalE [Smithella sp.]|nr:UDP-glucose 4-epimerase GalE [Smithella sp.]